MSHPYTSFVSNFEHLLQEARTLPEGGFEAERPELPAGAPGVLVFSPHPDDESIVGALPLRLLREGKYRVAVVAVTQGSNAGRQAARLEEMRGACGFLGMELITTAPGGLANINPRSRQALPEAWAGAVATVAALLQERKPSIVFMPHALDANSTHQGTHLLVLDALAALGADFQCHVVETEFWSASASPNLMIESTVEDVADLVAAISFHVGEVSRNPYHILLPAWMADNVRRGGELVGGQGGAVPSFTFATLYRAQLWKDQTLVPAQGKGRIVGAAENPAALF